MDPLEVAIEETKKRYLHRKIRITEIKDKPDSNYVGKVGTVTFIGVDPWRGLSLSGTWGGMNLYPSEDKFEIISTDTGCLTIKEFNRRCWEVFESMDNDYYTHIRGYKNVGYPIIVMSETDPDTGEITTFDFEPDMTERPEALGYICGVLDDGFND